MAHTSSNAFSRSLFVVVIFLFSTIALSAVDLPTTLLVDGESYTGVVYKSHDASRLTIQHDSGIACIPIASLSPELHKELDYVSHPSAPKATFARIGDTLEQFRLSQPKAYESSPNQIRWFDENGYPITVKFTDGRASELIIHERWNETTGDKDEFSPDDVNSLLAKYGFDGSWDKSDKFTFKSGDGQLVARCLMSVILIKARSDYEQQVQKIKQDTESTQKPTTSDDLKSTSELKKELVGKTKSEVKEYFGRKPYKVVADVWTYKPNHFSWLDPDAEVGMNQVQLYFGYDDKVSDVSFSRSR